jgi:hypothetical protein
MVVGLLRQACRAGDTPFQETYHLCLLADAEHRQAQHCHECELKANIPGQGRVKGTYDRCREGQRVDLLPRRAGLCVKVLPALLRFHREDNARADQPDELLNREGVKITRPTLAGCHQTAAIRAPVYSKGLCILPSGKVFQQRTSGSLTNPGGIIT